MQVPNLDFPRIKILTVGDSISGKSCLIKRYCEGRFVSKYIPTIGIDYGVKKIEVQAKKYSEALSDSMKTTSNNNNMNLNNMISSSSPPPYVRVNFWDVAGSEESFEIRNEFYTASQGIIIVFDVNNRASFEHLDTWWNELKEYISTLEDEGVGSSGGNGEKRRVSGTTATSSTAAGKAVENNNNSSNNNKNVPPVIFVLGNKCDDTKVNNSNNNRVVTAAEGQKWANDHHCLAYYDVSASSELNVTEAFESLFYHVMARFM